MEGARAARSASIDEYIALFPEGVQFLLNQLRGVIAGSAPEAEEAISYGMPVFKLNGNLVYFAAFKRHIGFYPGASGVAHFEKEISTYVHAKGSIQFPIDGPIPFDLVRRIVKFRVEENEAKAKERASQKRPARSKPRPLRAPEVADL